MNRHMWFLLIFGFEIQSNHGYVKRLTALKQLLNQYHQLLIIVLLFGEEHYLCSFIDEKLLPYALHQYLYLKKQILSYKQIYIAYFSDD